MSYTESDRIADLDYARDHAPCRRCKGLGYTPATYSSGGEPCGCTDPIDDDSDFDGDGVE